ncbi:Predicted PurR-regulated permease PerM [Tistlia consotensis]|uniref:Predicted PurR-regulated permease PerM n=1 Tax=Tistlia consotensis USBA 355 TaxID=560819 RepID=A0A1Y6CWX6_9PROT|nr:AI-2E family transporter [Tistlia consotensis]SMF83273.1 Predicted PurR-regulated permease PerM [Tistlia consotensis USBA 355]SNS32391.1 Predicted PurR-regulated permease PerM [Tistlia consotensis]
MTAERQLRTWAIGLVVFVVLLYLLRDILLPFVAGMAIAYFLDPICDRLERAGLSRTWSTVTVTAGFVVLLLLFLGLLVPMLVDQGGTLVAKLPQLVDLLREGLQTLLAKVQHQADPALFEKIRGAVTEQLGKLTSVLGGLVGGVLTGSLAIANFLSLLFLTPVVAFFLLRDWDRLVERIDGWLPRRQAPTIRRLAREADAILSGYVRGVASVCLILGTFYAIGLTAVGLSSGLIIGLIAGFLSFIPFLGVAIGSLLSIGLALLQFDEHWRILAVAVIFVVGQSAEGNFLTPKLVGDRIGLHPVLVIFALLAGGTLFGFTGVLLAIPVSAVIGVLARYSLSEYLASPLYTAGTGDEPPAVGQPAEQPGGPTGPGAEDRDPPA